MATIYPVPYQKINAVSSGELTIEIRRQEFVDVPPREGTTEIYIDNLYFRKVTVINKEQIDFAAISLAFFACLIEELNVEDLVTDNIHIAAYGSILSGTIKSDKLTGVEFNNCLLRDSLFLIGIAKIRIAFTKENIKLQRWKALLKPVRGLDYRMLIRGKQSYYVCDSKQLDFSSNFSKKATKKLRLNLSVKYNQDILDSSTFVSNAQLDSLSISGNPNGKVKIDSTKINSLYLYDFLPKGNISFYDIEPAHGAVDAKIGMHQCNLDNVWFDNMYFDQYAVISLYRTKFSQTIFTSCSFPEDYSIFEKFVTIENVHYPEKRSKNEPKEMYEIFLQLKKAMEATGNYYEAQKMQAIAHEALHKIPSIPRTDRLILWINSASNNHGLSIKRPFCGLVIFSVGLYILYLCSIGRIFTKNPVDWNLVGYYFSFIDILHSSDFLVEKSKLNGWSLIIDYSAKVVVGFFIYQFIAAFRKYGKK